MNEEIATEIAQRIENASGKYSANVVEFENVGDVFPIMPEESTGGEIHYGVYFYPGNDITIPQEIIKIVAEYDTDGIGVHPDIGYIYPTD